MSDSGTFTKKAEGAFLRVNKDITFTVPATAASFKSLQMLMGL